MRTFTAVTTFDNYDISIALNELTKEMQLNRSMEIDIREFVLFRAKHLTINDLRYFFFSKFFYIYIVTSMPIFFVD